MPVESHGSNPLTERPNFRDSLWKVNDRLAASVDIGGRKIVVFELSSDCGKALRGLYAPVLRFDKPVSFSIDEAPVLARSGRGQPFHKILFRKPASIESRSYHNVAIRVDESGFAVLLKAK